PPLARSSRKLAGLGSLKRHVGRRHVRPGLRAAGCRLVIGAGPVVIGVRTVVIIVGTRHNRSRPPSPARTPAPAWTPAMPPTVPAPAMAPLHFYHRRFL